MKATFTVVVEGKWYNNDKLATAAQVEKDVRNALKEEFEFLARKVTVKRVKNEEDNQ